MNTKVAPHSNSLGQKHTLSAAASHTSALALHLFMQCFWQELVSKYFTFQSRGVQSQRLLNRCNLFAPPYLRVCAENNFSFELYLVWTKRTEMPHGILQAPNHQIALEWNLDIWKDCQQAQKNLYKRLSKQCETFNKYFQHLAKWGQSQLSHLADTLSVHDWRKLLHHHLVHYERIQQLATPVCSEISRDVMEKLRDLSDFYPIP